MTETDNNACNGCVFLSRSHYLCNYLLMMDVRRGCPGGAECDKKMTKEEFYAMGMQKDWNKQAGKAMWAKGHGDAEIAKAMGVTQGTISYFRRRHWERECEAAPVEEQQATVAAEKPPVEELPDSEPDTSAEVLEAAMDALEAVEGTSPVEITIESPKCEPECSVDVDRIVENQQATSCVPCTKEGPGAAKTEDVDTRYPQLIQALEGATGNLTGMDAVMTAQIISALWGWTDKSDLLEAKACLDYLIRRHHG